MRAHTQSQTREDFRFAVAEARAGESNSPLARWSVGSLLSQGTPSKSRWPPLRVESGIAPPGARGDRHRARRRDVAVHRPRAGRPPETRHRRNGGHAAIGRGGACHKACAAEVLAICAYGLARHGAPRAAVEPAAALIADASARAVQGHIQANVGGNRALVPSTTTGRRLRNSRWRSCRTGLRGSRFWFRCRKYAGRDFAGL